MTLHHNLNYRDFKTIGLKNTIRAIDAIFSNVERSVADVDPMKYKCWSTKIYSEKISGAA